MPISKQREWRVNYNGKTENRLDITPHSHWEGQCVEEVFE